MGMRRYQLGMNPPTPGRTRLLMGQERMVAACEYDLSVERQVKTLIPFRGFKGS
jgi:hypothetical protein